MGTDSTSGTGILTCTAIGSIVEDVDADATALRQAFLARDLAIALVTDFACGTDSAATATVTAVDIGVNADAAAFRQTLLAG